MITTGDTRVGRQRERGELVRERERMRVRKRTDNIADSLWAGQWPRFFCFGKTMSKLNMSSEQQQQ